MPALRLTVCILAAVYSGPAVADTSCEVAQSVRQLTIEAMKLKHGDLGPLGKEAERTLALGPCATSMTPDLDLAAVDIGLLLDDWRRGGSELEVASGRRSSQYSSGTRYLARPSSGWPLSSAGRQRRSQRIGSP